jgi:hypothetical protein
MSKKRTKADRSQRQTEQQGKRIDRRPEEIEKTPSDTCAEVGRADRPDPD